MNRTIVAGNGGRAIGELVHVGLADDHRARGFEPSHHFRVFGGDAVGEDGAPASGLDAGMFCKRTILGEVLVRAARTFAAL